MAETSVCELFLVAVLVAVGTWILCRSLRLYAMTLARVYIVNNTVIRIYATSCDTMQKWFRRTQNPPRATSWGFAPPPGTNTFNRLQKKRPPSTGGRFRLVHVLVAVLTMRSTIDNLWAGERWE